MSYLLCRPNNGLNDMFNHIARCWAYADKHKRTLVIDSDNIGPACCFKCPFDVFFRLKDPHDNAILCPSARLWSELEHMTTQEFAQGKLFTYCDNCYSDFLFDIRKDHPEEYR